MASTGKNIRIEKPQHVRRLLTEVINEIRREDSMDKEKRARVLGYLGNIILTSIKDGDLEDRITLIEEQLQKTQKR